MLVFLQKLNVSLYLKYIHIRHTHTLPSWYK